MRHTLRETWSGLRRNLSMTVAVIVTMWVSLTLFGTGLMTTQQVDLVKGKWYDKIEISAFLCVKDLGQYPGGTCTANQDTTDAQRAAIQKALQSNPEVEKVYYETKAEAYQQFQQTYQNTPILNTLTESQMQDSFRIKLVDPNSYEGVVQELKAMPGIQAVQDLHTVLDPLFKALNAVKWAANGMSALLLIAAALQIGNTIRMAAFSRRRELGIMRMVGASNTYILLPFLLESLVAGVMGSALAAGTIALGKYLIIDRNAQLTIKTLRWIDWSQTGLILVAVGGVGILLSVLPTLIATRKYLRV